MKRLVDSLQPVYGLREARAIVRAVLEDAFGISYTRQCLCGITSLTPNQREELDNIMRRLAKGEPLQYVLGQARFCGMTFAVTPDTLIPRPETEWLVEHLEESDGPSILDVGTGSGCIAVAASLRHPGWHVEACDISAAALEVARANARANGACVEFFVADVLQPMEARGEGQRLTAIVSNPPYVCASEATGMSSWVLDHEPHTALFVPDEDPLLFYRSIAGHGKGLLAPGGRLLLECNTRLADNVAGVLAGMGYAHAQVHDDCFGRPRFVTATLP